MRNKLKITILTTVIILTTPSCSSFRNVGNFGGLIPEEKITLKEKMDEYIAGADSVYSLNYKENLYLREKQLRFKRNWKF